MPLPSTLLLKPGSQSRFLFHLINPIYQQVPSALPLNPIWNLFTSFYHHCPHPSPSHSISCLIANDSLLDSSALSLQFLQILSCHCFNPSGASFQLRKKSRSLLWPVRAHSLATSTSLNQGYSTFFLSVPKPYSSLLRQAFSRTFPSSWNP